MARRSALRKQEEAQPLVILEEFLPYRVNVLAALTANALSQIYEKRFGLTIPGWRIIVTLGQYEFRTARDIANHGVMHKSTVSRAVAVLEKRGLVLRKANADDRREELLELTPEGRAIYVALAPEALAFEERLLSVLAPEEQKTFFGLVDKLGRHARSLGPEPGEEA
ncbi:MarR family winged helix-turn-helix transcriptional regulator [Microvirga pudoricolor]|uniref:MarR family winged helix-turn-helix transcriptional regulator n=1 Tax=Microvirga pudoricolor TaxID=2778729 RepID=UPI00194F74FF|nr:MarR family transcriptional regulator [Microvirga pudoricolor]MBM6594340.1 MarR family transcriptional regulator [Microvirga pudoricolor]